MLGRAPRGRRTANPNYIRAAADYAGPAGLAGHPKLVADGGSCGPQESAPTDRNVELAPDRQIAQCLLEIGACCLG